MWNPTILEAIGESVIGEKYKAGTSSIQPETLVKGENFIPSC